MKLTRLQYQALKLYWRFHTKGFTAAQILRGYGWPWALLAGLAVGAYLLLSQISPPFACFFAGILIGAIVRDIRHLQVAFQLWPLNHEIYDWRKVAQFIESHERGLAAMRGDLPVEEESTCAHCGGTFKVADMIAYEHHRVCARCKPVFLQKLAEGAAIETPLPKPPTGD